jgi:hypothetical protein
MPTRSKSKKSRVPPNYIVPGETRYKTLTRINKYLSKQDTIHDLFVYEQIERLFGIKMTENEYEEIIQDIIDNKKIVWLYNKREKKWYGFREFDREQFFESTNISEWDTSNLPGEK